MEIKDIQEAAEKAIAPVVESVKSAVAGIKAAADKIDSVDARLKAVEALPVLKDTPAVVSAEEVFKGYKLSDQMLDQRIVAAKNPGRFKALTDPAKANDMAKFFILATKALKGKDPSAFAELKAIQQKAAMQEDTNSEGGFLVPPEYEWDMIELARPGSFALNECRVVPMSRDILNLPRENAMISVAWTAEESAATQTEPTFEQVQLNARRLDGYGKVSNELLQDSAVDIVGILMNQFAFAIGQELDNQVLNGTGTPVSGILSAAVSNSVVMTGLANFSSITFTNLSNMIAGLNSGYLAGAKFIVGRQGLHFVRTLKDSNNNPIFAQIAGPVPGQIYGFDYILSEKVTNTTGTATPFMGFGNPKNFIIGRRLGTMAIDLDPYSLFTTYQTQFRLVTRWGMAIGNPAAFNRLVTG